MDLVPLFVETVEELQARCSLTSTDYDLLQASALLRRLLIDGSAIGSRSEKELDLKACFSWMMVYRAVGPDDPANRFVSGMLFDPSLVHAMIRAVYGQEPDSSMIQEQSGPVAKLLSAETVLSNQARFTVRDVVKHAANVMGGVHYGSSRGRPPHGDLVRAFTEAREEMMWTIRAIGRVVYRGFEPLVVANLIVTDHVARTGARPQAAPYTPPDPYRPH